MLQGHRLRPQQHGPCAEQEVDAPRAGGGARFAGLREELLDKSPFELSGGQKRRVAIAGVIAMDPEVLILDEPTAGLDPGGPGRAPGPDPGSISRPRATPSCWYPTAWRISAAPPTAVLVMNHGHGGHAATGRRRSLPGRRSWQPMGLRVPADHPDLAGAAGMGLPVDASTLTVDDALHQLIRHCSSGRRSCDDAQDITMGQYFPRKSPLHAHWTPG